MIKFFRHIRKSLLSENKISKYLLYAIGEIVLVVIGILIALWINTKNQEYAQQQKIDTILVKIQNDILQDIHNSEWLIENYMRKDSIYDKMMSDSLTAEDIRAIPMRGGFSPNFVTTWWMTYYIQSSGYEQLKANLDMVPDKYDELIRILDFNHINRKATFNAYNKNSEDIARQYKYYLNDNQPWYAIDEYNSEYSDAHIDYILNHPKFKNQMNAMLGSVWTMVWEYTAYHKEILQIYLMINELLGDKAKPLPKEIRTTSVANELDAAQFIGRYVFSYGHKNVLNSETIEVFVKDKDLYYKTDDTITRGPLLSMHAEKPWFSMSRSPAIWCFKCEQKNTLKIFHGERGITEWVKVDTKPEEQ
ncbi:MAG: hypothetical protein HWE15_14155 [Algoriphagus sp.]|uniref:hypothetical protein n=1 Tax=Algoriphagus sp. TaxID=1872435 RepID=UPI00180BE201|nr:hypothetical protein [Algoriphagus sp.]NVJ87448.1 hypothetical protein [Algoriphagus sp.]